jgi:hypothetical protein
MFKYEYLTEVLLKQKLNSFLPSSSYSCSSSVTNEAYSTRCLRLSQNPLSRVCFVSFLILTFRFVNLIAYASTFGDIPLLHLHQILIYVLQSDYLVQAYLLLCSCTCVRN